MRADHGDLDHPGSSANGSRCGRGQGRAGCAHGQTRGRMNGTAKACQPRIAACRGKEGHPIGGAVRLKRSGHSQPGHVEQVHEIGVAPEHGIESDRIGGDLLQCHRARRGRQHQGIDAGHDAPRGLRQLCQAPLMGLSITGAQRSRVAHFLSVAHDMARVVEAADVPPDTLDVAGVFRPVGPDGGGR